MLKYKVGELLKKPEGAKEKHALSERLTFSQQDGIKPAGLVTGEIVFLNLGDQIHVDVKKAVLPVHIICSRCLKPFTINIAVSQSSREFFLERPDDEQQGENNFHIDQKALTIDLTEMLRQDFLLHSPDYPVCSGSCKGLCVVCGQDLNKKSCACVQESVEKNKPFTHLKSLLKSNEQTPSSK